MSEVKSPSKVKLPSISELTSHSVQPQIDALPLLLTFRAPAPGSTTSSTTQQLLLPVIPSETSRPPSREYTSVPYSGYPSYQYYSYGQSAPPQYYQHPIYRPGVHQGQMVQSQPYQTQNLMYSVAEVINKPMNKCHRCGTTETPEWRRGPNGLRTLCNACGLFHAKLVKRKGAALAAEEVLNNKVCKGKNGRRISIKKQAMDESKKRMTQAQVTEIPPIPYPGQLTASSSEHPYMPRPRTYPYGARLALPPPVLKNTYSLPVLRN